MTTKHTPATPLPDGDAAARETYRRADAYPRLVARVKELAPNDPLLAELGE